MSTISAAAVKSLRDRTNLSMMECKNALVEANGDMDRAIEIIKARMGKKLSIAGEREAAEGRIATFVDPVKKVAAIMELRCESAPVAKSEAFVTLANILVKQIAATDPKTVEELLASPQVGDPKKKVSDHITDAYAMLRENMKPSRFMRMQGDAFGDYVHHDASLGVLLQVSGTPKDPGVLRDVCMHIAAYVPTPLAARREDIPVAAAEKELAAAREKVAAQNKPANIAEKIVEGQMKAWYSQVVLVDQPFVKDESQTVGQVLKTAGVEAVRFARFKVGELS